MSDIVTAIDRMMSETEVLSARVDEGEADGLGLAMLADKACRLAKASAGIARYMADTMRLLHGAHFKFRTLEEARGLASCVAGLFPEPQKYDIAICELLLNAVEHGNLGISFEEKSQLLASDGLDAEVARRLVMPPYAGRYATLQLERAPGIIQLTIRDEGEGFDWRPYLEFRPEGLHELHGRGIATARRLCFPELLYRGSGNEVTVTVVLSAPNNSELGNRVPERN
ncbi:hypothetical protein W02_18920 [Nitrospira sp. KM1]|uniref:ATP-binding protein n=1 Tax=Nitrospira sp. KM1 TaxID=1936990 RepID=UPI0013A752C4|nr:ATP-binding protein [Nitrospira sp. KM1]BCA54752.1 hypothetical protein W02_18920 [Nitrospira sp. KM1]